MAKPAGPIQPSRVRQCDRAILAKEKLGRGAAADQAARLPGFSDDRTPQQPPPSPAGMGLHTTDGARKYLTAAERDSFLAAAELADRDVQTLCMTLAYSGCRLSEALALTADRVDLGAGTAVFESLKKRRDGIYRAVPVPLPCSGRSSWCMACANCRPSAAAGTACGCGRGRG